MCSSHGWFFVEFFFAARRRLSAARWWVSQNRFLPTTSYPHTGQDLLPFETFETSVALLLWLCSDVAMLRPFCFCTASFNSNKEVPAALIANMSSSDCSAGIVAPAPLQAPPPASPICADGSG